MINRAGAFVLGMRQFRCSFTSRYVSHSLNVAYDWGRAAAHFLTLYYFDQ